MLRQ
jgi:hypothetical protein